MTWRVQSASYLDEGAYYFTEEQRISDWLIVDINILSIAAPVSQSYLRNPAQSVYGYITGTTEQVVTFEKEMRFDTERVVDDFNNQAWLSRLLCVYFTTMQLNLRELATAIQTPLPYLQTAISGILPVAIRQLDSIRFKMRNPGQFEFIVYWFESPTPNPCNPVRNDLPELPPITPFPLGPVPGSTSPGPPVTPGNGAPVQPLTPRPSNAFPGDFGVRNQTIPTKPIQNYQRGRVSTGYLSNCSINVRSAAWPTPPGQQPPFFTGITSSTPSVPPVTFTQTPGSDCGNGVRGFFTQNGTVIEAGAQGLISWSWPVFARYTDGSWAAVAP